MRRFHVAITWWLAVLTLACWLPAGSAEAQAPRNDTGYRPDQPVVANDPSLQRRQPATNAQGGPISPGQAPNSGASMAAPFTLTPYEEAQLDRVLQAWEQHSKQIESFECEFTRWEFDPVADPADEARRISRGKVMYSAPDKGLFVVDQEAIDGKLRESPHPERWVCDGQSIYEYKYETKQIVENPLPPELRGRAITEGPLPFLFGAEAESLKQRYFLRLITPPDAEDEIWIEARPRYQRDAADFAKAEIILKYPSMHLFALQLYLPSTHPSTMKRTIFQFDKPKINQPDFLRLFKGDPFAPNLPDRSWSRAVAHSERGGDVNVGARPQTGAPRR